MTLYRYVLSIVNKFLNKHETLKLIYSHFVSFLTEDNSPKMTWSCVFFNDEMRRCSNEFNSSKMNSFCVVKNGLIEWRLEKIPIVYTEKRMKLIRKRIGWMFKESKLNTFQIFCVDVCLIAKRESLIKLSCVLYSPGLSLSPAHSLRQTSYFTNGDAVMCSMFTR